MRLRLIHKMLWLPVVAAALACGLAACSDGSCNSNTSSIPQARFYSSSTKQAIAIDSLTVFGVGAPGDSMLINCGRSVGKLSLPLRATTSSTQFVIHYDQQQINNPLFNDTITLRYEPLPYFESSECGAMFVFDMKGCSHTSHFIDSVKVMTPRITNLDVENIKIYMRTE